MKFDVKRVLTFKDLGEAELCLGGKFFFSDCIECLAQEVTRGDEREKGVLVEVKKNLRQYPFILNVEGSQVAYSYIYPAEVTE